MKKSKTSQTDMDSAALAKPDAIMGTAPATVKAWSEVMTECSKFVMDRLQQDLETQQAMLTCKTPAELFKLQSAFYQQATQQYSEQATRMFELISKSTQQTIAQANSGHARKYDDIPL